MKALCLIACMIFSEKNPFLRLVIEKRFLLPVPCISDVFLWGGGRLLFLQPPLGPCLGLNFVDEAEKAYAFQMQSARNCKVYSDHTEPGILNIVWLCFCGQLFLSKKYAPR